VLFGSAAAAAATNGSDAAASADPTLASSSAVAAAAELGAAPLLPGVRALCGRLGAQLAALGGTLAMHDVKKNVAILQDAGRLARELGAGRLVSCKSAKDRTSMSVTLEQAQLLHRHHGLGAAQVRPLSRLMRLHGVRLENVSKNIGKRVFAFNWLQQQQLPDDYKPPPAAAGKAIS